MAAGSDVQRLVGLGVVFGALSALALPLLLGCGPGDGPPETRECESATPVAILEVELGDTTAPFTPSARVEQVRGGQGLSMLSFRIGVRSTGGPTCIGQRTQAGPTLFGRPLQIVSHEGDWWVTAPLFVITDSRSIPVTTTVGALTVTRTMSVMASADAGPDAR